MIKIKGIKNLLIIALFAACVFGCGEDFLETPPLGQQLDVNFPSDQEEAILATFGAYNKLRLWRIHAGGFPTFDIMSDDASKGTNPGDGLLTGQPFEEYSFDESNALIRDYYTDLYRGIRSTHLFLDKADQIEMEPEIETRLTAECRFLRGMFYFLLTRAYGDVPLVTNGAPESSMDQSSRAQIYSEIIVPDLTYAINNLGERSEYPETELGRATKGAARAMLARAYLFIGDFSEVERLTLDIINSGEYQLEPNLELVFSVNGEHGPGSIFEIGALPETYEAGGNQYANTWGVRGTSPNLGWGFGRPTLDLINFYGDDDPRMQNSILFVGETVEGLFIGGDDSTPDSTFVDGNLVEVETYNQKTFVPGTEPRFSFAHNRRLMRYADVLLMAAEALNENGNVAQALIYLNRVRERARNGNPTFLPDIVTTGQAELRDIIIDERRRELCLEGLRYWDLVRTGRAPAVLGPLGFIEGKHELYPFPQSEIDISGGRFVQNPGWN